MSKQPSILPGVLIGAIAGIAATLLLEQFRKPAPARLQAARQQPAQALLEPSRASKNNATTRSSGTRNTQSKKASANSPKSPAAKPKASRKKPQAKSISAAVPSLVPASASRSQLQRVV